MEVFMIDSNETVAYENGRDVGYAEGYEDGLNKCKDFADELYKVLCKRQNWNALKDQWLENGECHWLKQKINNTLEEFENWKG